MVTALCALSVICACSLLCSQDWYAPVCMWSEGATYDISFFFSFLLAEASSDCFTAFDWSSSVILFPLR